MKPSLDGWLCCVRYGFNGKENDNEVKGEGMQLDYGFRIYDPRIGRFLSVDPLTQSYPHYTPYQFAGNKTIIPIDLDGLEEKVVINDYQDGKLVATQTAYYKDVIGKIPTIPAELKAIPNTGTVLSRWGLLFIALCVGKGPRHVSVAVKLQQ